MADKQVNLKMPGPLYEAIRKLAEENERSVSAEIRLAIADRLKGV